MMLTVLKLKHFHKSNRSSKVSHERKHFKKLQPNFIKAWIAENKNTTFRVIISRNTHTVHLKSFKNDKKFRVIHTTDLAKNFKHCQETVRLRSKIQFLLCSTLLYDQNRTTYFDIYTSHVLQG